MDIIQGFGSAVFWGIFDSFKGICILFRLDKELNRRRKSRLSPTHSNSPIRRKQSESREQTPVRTSQKHEENTVMSRILQCGLLNGAIFLCSILLFEYAFLPCMKVLIILALGRDSPGAQTIWYWVQLALEITFQSLWVVPLFALSKFINNLWFQDIGQSAYKYSRGRSTASLSLSKTVADFIFSTVVETLFLIQALIMTLIPISWVGYPLYIYHYCLLYSLYAFEYKWGEMGWEIHKRLTCVETHWSYFFGFGLPLVLVTQISNSCIINGCIFSMLFPLYIISANEANPAVESCYRIQVFTPVISVSNSLFSLLGKEKKPVVPQRPLIAQHRR